MNFTRAAWLVCVLSLLMSRGAEAQVRRFALVIGNNRPDQAGTEALRYADDDAIATHRLLRDAGVESLLLVRLDDDSRSLFAQKDVAGVPSVADLERAFSRLLTGMRSAEASGQSSEFFFVYSGHGDVDHGEGYVALEDGRLTRSRLFELLARAAAGRNHVFIDACKSYFVAFDRGPGGKRAPHAGAMVARVPARLANTGFVLSTSSDRESHEWERYHGGILSHELRSALRGAADANLDARIDYGELGAFLTSANRSIQNPRFRPDFLVRAPGDDLAGEILRWHGGRASLSVGPADFGHFYLENQLGERLLDAHPSPGQKLALWMPSERPLFVRRADGLGEYRLDSAQPVHVAVLTPSLPEAHARGAIGLAFEQLFALPFGEEDVQSFRVLPRGDRLDDPARASDERRTVRVVSGTTALVGLGAGLVLTGLGVAEYLGSAGTSGQHIAENNEQARKYHLASVAGYGLFALAGSVWAWSRWGRARVAPDLAGGGQLGLRIDGRF